MITDRYKYHTIARETVDGRRLYATPDGKRLPSVTTILDATKPEEKRRALQEWRNRVGHERAQQITTEAAARGTRMHTYLEEYVKTGNLNPRGSNPYSWASHAMAQTVIEHGLKHVTEFWGVEIPLYFPGIYAGTSDGAGLHQDQETILDYKQTNRPKRDEWIDDYKLQLAAYAEAHNELHGTRIQKGVILMCVRPETDEQGHLVKPPQYQEFVIQGSDFMYWRDQWWRRLEQYFEQQT